MTFEWSFKPIIVLMNIFGIPFSITKLASEKLSFGFATYYGLLIFSILSAFQLFDIIAIILAENGKFTGTNFKSSTNKWNAIINFVNEKWISLGTHIILMTYTLVKWKKLVRVLLRMEQYNVFNSSTFYRLRSICWYGFGFAIAVCFSPFKYCNSKKL